MRRTNNGRGAIRADKEKTCAGCEKLGDPKCGKTVPKNYNGGMRYTAVPDSRCTKEIIHRYQGGR